MEFRQSEGRRIDVSNEGCDLYGDGEFQGVYEMFEKTATPMLRVVWVTLPKSATVPRLRSIDLSHLRKACGRPDEVCLHWERRIA